jgi:hypothetical protein
MAAIFEYLQQHPMRVGGEPMDYEPLQVRLHTHTHTHTHTNTHNRQTHTHTHTHTHDARAHSFSLCEPLQVMAKRTSRAFGQSPAFGLVPEDLPGGWSDAQRLKMLETSGSCYGCC